MCLYHMVQALYLYHPSKVRTQPGLGGFLIQKKGDSNRIWGIPYQIISLKLINIKTKHWLQLEKGQVVQLNGTGWDRLE